MPPLPADFAIRPMRRPEEVAAVAEWMASSEPWLTLRRDREACLTTLLDSTREVYAAVIGENVVGAVVLHLAGVLNGYLQTVAVRPDWRCSGVGTRLVQFAEERVFRQSPNVFLCVSSFNEHAQKLYLRLGYERVGELHDFVVSGHSEILMRKTKGPRQP
jgi:ribosomal protein S18 acetylase RimI-like enzyme